MPQELHRLAVAAIAAAGLGSSAHAADHRATATPIAISVPFAPAPVKVGDRIELLYEIHLANYAHGGVTLDELQVSDPASGAVLGEFKGAALAPLLDLSVGDQGQPSARRLPGGGFGVIYMETPLAKGAPAPNALAWRLTVSDASPPRPGKPARDLPPVSGEVTLDRRAPVVIGFPFKGGDWVAGNGPSNTSDHRRSLIVVDGTARIAQRFAIDWVKVAPDGRLFHGDKAANPNWSDFGTEVLAVADATVSDAHDGVPENEPSDKLAVPITLETIAGNYLILDLGEGRFALYAHLQPGSQKVRLGDVVHRGQALALLGNTGNSDAPHLHFHVANANSPLGAEGVPYVFDSYESLGSADLDKVMAAGVWTAKPGDPPAVRRQAIPVENEVVRVP